MNDYSTYEKRLAEIRMKGMELRAEEAELRFNPYHDPRNGRFTTASGGGGAVNIGKAMKKSSTRFMSSFNENGTTIISDGYRIHKHSDISRSTFKSTDAKTVEKAYNGVMQDFENAKRNGEVKELALPTLNDISKNRQKIGTFIIDGYDFGENLPLVNPRYLREAMLAVPNGKAYVKNNDVLSPIYIKNNKGDEAIILPIRKRLK